MAHITFLGTAGNSSVATKGFRASGGIIIQVDDLQLHLDPGPGALKRVRECGLNPHHTSAVLVTSNHINHCNDLNLVVDAMTHSGIEHRGIVVGAKSVLQESDDNRPMLTKFHQNLLEKIIVAEPKHKIAIDLIEINTFTANHHDHSAIGFKLFCPKVTIGYSGDTILTNDLLEGVTGSAVLILNVPYPGNKGAGRGLDTSDALKIISHVRPKIAILTHFSPEMLKADPLNEAREIMRITGVNTLAASDGLGISPSGGSLAPVKGYSS